MALSLFTEGDYISTVDGLFFAVKGGRHSDELVIAILRYIPDETGDRALNGIKYRRVYDNDSTTRYLDEHFPSYINHIDWLGFRLQSVPRSLIAEVYKPVERLQKILADPQTILETKIAEFVSALSASSSVSASFFGVSGSILIGLDNEDSDIDLNVYGKQEGQKVYDTLKELRSRLDWISPYDDSSIGSVLISRWGDSGQDMDKLREIECRKFLHGLVHSVDYFMRLLIDETATQSTPLGSVSISATITDASQSIYTPCSYRVSDVTINGSPMNYSIKELKSYRGKFTEQVKKGGRIRARGTLEQVSYGGCTYYRLILGRKGDYLIPV